MEHSKEKINFLDLTIYKGDDNKLQTTLVRKPTDCNSLLHYGSFHPFHLKNNIPFGQFQRLRRICDLDSDFQTQSQHTAPSAVHSRTD